MMNNPGGGGGGGSCLNVDSGCLVGCFIFNKFPRDADAAGAWITL